MIIVDSNEAAESARLVESLRKIAEVAVRPLEAGDYLVVGRERQALIERKRVFDFLNSLKGRLWDQLSLLKSFEGERILLLEGYLGLYRKSRWNETAILAFLDKIVNEWDIPIINTPDTRATLSYLAWKNKSLGEAEEMREHPLRVSGREMTPTEQSLYTLEGLCGHKTAKALLQRFGTLGEVVSFFHKNDERVIEHMLRDLKVGGRRIPSSTLRRIHLVVNTKYTEEPGDQPAG